MEDRLTEQDGVSSSKDEAFVSRLKMVIEKQGSISSLARAANLSESAIRKWRDGVSEPSRDRLVALAKAAQVSLEWLATGQGLISSPAASSQGKTFQHIPQHSTGEVQGSQTINSERGFYHSPTSQASLPLIQFTEAAFKEYSSSSRDPGHYWFYRIGNESMEPTISPGDFCIIAERSTRLSALDDGIYTLVIDGIAAVRRIERLLNNQIRISVDNPKYGASDTLIDLSAPPSSLDIVGKVIYICQAVAVA